MAHKTFISYKYSEARDLRDRIIRALGSDATYYQGETSDSPDMTDYSTAWIKQKLSDMIFNTSVTILIVSPNMIRSKWIDWEIEYSLRHYTRNSRTSLTNGVVGVIMKCDGDYSWLRTMRRYYYLDRFYDDAAYLYPIVNNNRFNSHGKIFTSRESNLKDELTDSYISLITEEVFLNNPDKYIDNAYDKSYDDASGYDLCLSRQTPNPRRTF